MNQFELTEAVFPIGIIATKLNIHQRTLRIYDKEGILCPTRTKSKRRYYSNNDILKGQFILFLTKNLGLNLVGVKIILNLLKQAQVDINDYIEYANNIALNMGITEKIQQENIIKSSKRGRKRKVDIDIY